MRITTPLTTLPQYLPSCNIWTDPVKTGVITSANGSRINPITGEKETHRGIDIGVPLNTEVMAVKSGEVTKAGYSQSYGNYLGYRTYDGYDIFYAHLSSSAVNIGDVVSRGEVIAYSGSTGQSTGPHLHYEIEYEHQNIDPQNYTSLKNID